MSVVVQSGLEKETVSLEAVDLPVSMLVQLAAKRIGVESSESSGVVYIGKLNREDRATLVRRVRRLTSGQITSLCQSLLSNNGTVTVFPDGLAVIADRVDCLERVSGMLDEIELAPSSNWVIQYHIVSFSDTWLRDFLADASGIGAVALTVNTASNNPAALVDATIRANLEGSLDAIVKAAQETGETHLISSPLLFLSDGGSATISRSTRIPFRNEIVRSDDNGTYRSSEIVFEKIGLDVTAGLREAGPTAAKLDTRVSISDANGASAGVPIVASDSLETTSDLRSGGVYLLGSISRSGSAISKKGFLSWGDSQRVDNSTLLIWARVYAVDGAAIPAQ